MGREGGASEAFGAPNRSVRLCNLAHRVSRTFITGGTGVIGTALVTRLIGRGDEVVALARSDASSDKLAAHGAHVVRGEAFDEDALARGMEGCERAFNVAGINSLCVEDPREMKRLNVDGAVAAVRAAAHAGVPRLVHTSSAATIGEPPGTVGNERTPHRGWYLSTYERTKTEGERAAMACARELGQDLVCVNPSSVQGPGRAGGTARFLLAFLDGRLKVFVPTTVSLVDIDDCVSGHLLAAEHGLAGERYVLNGFALPIRDALALAGEVAGVERAPRLLPRPVATVAAAIVERGFRLAGRKPPVCREMVRTLLHGHRYDGSRSERELGLRYTDPRETLRKTVEWARAQGLLRAR
jgi:dihydroflavonol-4-reductase